MSNVSKLYEGLSDGTRASLDNLRKEIKAVGDVGDTALTYFCYGYLIGQGSTADDANKATILAQSKNFWFK